MTGSLIEAKDITVVFGTGKSTVRAVDGVSLSVAPGEAVGIVGESGSGKSTLARVLAGIQFPTLGDVTFQGRPIFERRTRVRGAAQSRWSFRTHMAVSTRACPLRRQ